MPLYFSCAYTTGQTLFATVERLSDGYVWNPTAVAFQSAPTFANSKISLTEGSSQYAGKYAASIGSLGSPGKVRVHVHNSGGTQDLAVYDCRVLNSDEVVDIDYVNAISTSNVTTISAYLGNTGAAINGSNVNTLASHDPGATLGTSTLTQSQVTGGAYALNSSSFAFNAALDFTTTQKAATIATVTNVTNAVTLTSAYNAAKTASQAGDAMALTATAIDNIWDEAQSGHSTAGTFGKYLDAQISLISTPPSAATIADAVWDEVRADHGTAGTFGQGVASVQGNVTGSVGSLAAQAKADVNAECDTAISDVGLTTTITGRIDVAISTRLASASYTSPPSAATISDTVWDELRSDHVGVGSFGEGAASVQGNVTGSVNSIVSSVTVGTNNDKTDYRLSATGVDDIWDETQSGHTGAGTFGRYLDSQISTISSFPSVSDIADSVWDEARSGHANVGSFGEGVASVQGNITGSIGSLALQAKADVNAECDAALSDVGVTTTITGRIDDAMTSRAAASTAVSNVELTVSRIGKLDYLDASISTLMLASSYTAPDNAGITAIKAKTDNLPASPAAVGSAMALDSTSDVYFADIHFEQDDANSQDEYTVTWFKNGIVQSGVTSPLIQVIKRVDGTDLIAIGTAMTLIGSTGSAKYDASGAERVTAGEAVLVRVSATINLAVRTFQRVIGRDSTT